MLKRVCFIWFAICLMACKQGEVFTKDENKLLSAVPTNSSLVVEIPNYSQLVQELSKSKPLLSLQNSVLIKNIKNNLSTQMATLPADNLQKPMVITSSPIGINDYDFLLLLPKESKQDSIAFSTSMAKKYTFSPLNYDGLTVYNFNTGTQNFYFAYVKNAIVFSKNILLVQQSIRQSTTAFSLYKDKNFQKVYSKIPDPKIASVFFKHDNLNRYIPLFNGHFKSINFQNYSDWSAFDVEEVNEKIVLKGATQPRDSLSSSVFVYKNIAPRPTVLMDKTPTVFSEMENIRFLNLKSYLTYQKKIFELCQYFWRNP